MSGTNGGLPQNNPLPPTPPGIPIDNLWNVIKKWAGWIRTFEDGSQIVQVFLKKAELDRVVQICYRVKVLKGIPIDNLWVIILKWAGWQRTFEDGSVIVQVILKKDELDRVAKICYGIGQGVQK